MGFITKPQSLRFPYIDRTLFDFICRTTTRQRHFFLFFQSPAQMRVGEELSVGKHLASVLPTDFSGNTDRETRALTMDDQ